MPKTFEATTTEPLMTVTEDAARQVGVVRSNEPENASKTLRVFVEKGGCSGLQYGMVFDEKRDDDHELEFFGETVLVDDFSATPGSIATAMSTYLWVYAPRRLYS